MAAPTFINSTGPTNFQGATGVTLTLPSPVTNGDVLVSYVQSSSLAGVSLNNSWILLDVDSAARMATAYRVVDGTQGTTVAWSWSNSVSGNAGIAQFRGAISSPIGGYSFNDGASTTISSNPLQSSTANSLFFCAMGLSDNTGIGLPTHYTNIQSGANNQGSTRACYETLGSAYATIDAIAQTVTNFNWQCHIVEILGSPPLPPVQEVGNLSGSSANWTDSSVGSSTSNTGVLPSNRKTNDLLIGIIQSTTGGITFTWPGDWTRFISLTSGSSLAVAYRKVDGSETAPTVTYSTTGTRLNIASLANVQNVSGNPIGATSTNAGSGASITCSALTTQNNNSMVLGIIQANGVISASPMGTNFTLSKNETGGSSPQQLGWQLQSTAGNTSSSISATNGGSGAWSAALIEIDGVGSSVFRKTLSQLGGRISSRQIQGWGN